MFGIGMPEMILICALALIVVGPDKLPELARSIAKTIFELKKTATGLKENLTAEITPALDTVKPELEEASKALKENLDQQSRFSPSVNDASHTVQEDTPENTSAEQDHASNISTDEFIARAQQAKVNSSQESKP